MKRIAIAAALLALASPAVAQTSTVPMNPPSVWDMPMNPPSVRSEKPITIEPNPAPKPKPRRATVLPPLEYDKHYEGDLTLRMVTTREALRIACHWKEIEDDGRLACAIRHADGQSCTIVLVEDAMMRQYGLNSGILLRHEIGHCNGWDNDHAGERPVWPLTLINPKRTQ